jgi:two-component system, chemotaxis family, response regulator Rcp1
MAEVASRKPLEILIIEDNPADVRMTQLALETAAISHRLHIAESGEKGLLFLLQDGEFAKAPRPDVVLLDLKLPKVNGFGVLAAIRAHRQMKDLTVVVFTGSSLKQDEIQSHQSAADHFVTKPVGLDAYVAAMNRIRDLAESRPR